MRKQVILKKRRVGWKNYMILSSNWVKPLLALKQLVNFTQNQSLYFNTTTPSHSNVFNKKSTYLNSVGFGVNSINYTNLNTKMLQFFNKSTKSTKPRKFLSNVQFNSLQSIDKLTSLGFNFPNLVLNNNYYILNKALMYAKQSCSYKTINHLTTINTAVALRSICIYTTLYHVNNK